MPAKKSTNKVSPQKEAAIRTDEDRKIVAAARVKSVASHGSGFMNFIREQGVVGLAVGLAIGTAAGASVKVIVDQFINPLVALMTQGVDLSKLAWSVKVGESQVSFGWGAVLSSLITLIATALVVYLVIHLAKLDRLDKKKD